MISDDISFTCKTELNLVIKIAMKDLVNANISKSRKKNNNYDYEGNCAIITKKVVIFM